MMTMQTRVFVVHMSLSLGSKLFIKVRELEMITEGYVWIVTSGLTDLFNLVGSDVVEAMQGVLGVRPLVPKSKELQSFVDRWIRRFHQTNQDMKPTETSIFGLWAYDTLWALAMAAERVGNSRSSINENEANVNSASPFALEVSQTGPKLLKALLETRFTGLAGEFNIVNGQLEQRAYQIVNVIERMERPVGTWTPSAGISRKHILNVTTSYSASKENLRSIIWPGDSTNIPRGWEVPKNGKRLRIAVPQKPGFNDFLKVETDPETHVIKVSGYYKEMFDAVMAALPYAVPYTFIPYPFLNPDGSRAKSYDDLVYQVSLQKDYDGALGDITVTANRSNYADFTMPYAEGGVACIVPMNYEDVDDLFTFLEPLTEELWITATVLYILTAVVIWILSKRIVHRSRDPPSQHPGMICYFPSFAGEGIQASLICLILVAWAFVANLLNSTYTASLSSRLTVARLLPTVTNVTELIKNGDYVGCQEGSFLDSYLVKLRFQESKIKRYRSDDDCNEALSLGSKNGGISAYCDVLPHIRLILSKWCGKYMMIDPIYRTDGFAFAFPKGFPAVTDISRAIIQLTEDGTILDIEQQGVSSSKCIGPESSSSPKRVSLQSFLVLFGITGCVTVTCLVVSLLIHQHNKRPLPQRISDFNASTCSIILALLKHFKQNDPSSLPRTANNEDEVVQVEEIGSSSNYFIESKG